MCFVFCSFCDIYAVFMDTVDTSAIANLYCVCVYVCVKSAQNLKQPLLVTKQFC